jgi:hypothetical protein
VSAKNTCPGCGGEKTKTAELCAKCRRRANVVGARSWIDTGRPPAPITPRTPQQNRVYHGKLSSIALLEERPLKDVKDGALQLASSMFRRSIESSTELSEIEMEQMLEALDDRLDELGYGRPST